MLSTRTTTVLIFATSIVATVYLLWLALDAAGSVPEIPPQISGLMRATLAVAVLGLGLASMSRIMLRAALRVQAERLAAVERAIIEVVQREVNRAGAGPASPHVYASRAGAITTAELPRLADVDPDVIDLGERLSRRVRDAYE
jgi:hypothetical protein